MTRLVSLSLTAVALFVVTAPSAQAQQYRSYYYSSDAPILTPTPAGFSTSPPSPAVVYGTGMPSAVNYGTRNTQFYSPGYAPTYYRYAGTTYTTPYDDRITPPYFEPLPRYSPSFSYTPGYYSQYTTPGYYSPRRGGAALYLGY
jgi:hypothetical protein